MMVAAPTTATMTTSTTTTMIRSSRVDAVRRITATTGLWLLLVVSLCAMPSVTANASIARAVAMDGNVVDKGVAIVKEYSSRFVEGFQQMRTDHQRCTQIRAKQKAHKNTLKAQWEKDGMEKGQINQQLKAVNGGITYEEYAFLQKGKADRSKLMNLAFYSFSIRSMWPYLLWFGPDSILPAKIRPMTLVEMTTMSRHRAHAAIEALVDFERRANEGPGLLGGGNQKKLGAMQSTAKQLLSHLDKGPKFVMELLDKQLYSDATDKTKDNLTVLPKMITKGLAAAISGKKQNFGIHFMRRVQVLNHLRKVKDADEFLVNEGVNMDSLNFQLLSQTCADRCISVMGRSETDMRDQLQIWLESTTVDPAERLEGTGYRYNGILARSALMTYFAVADTVDTTSASVLPRMLFRPRGDSATAEETASSSSS